MKKNDTKYRKLSLKIQHVKNKGKLNLYQSIVIMMVPRNKIKTHCEKFNQHIHTHENK